jgi:5'(3')-deoxyribonucleotidase
MPAIYIDMDGVVADWESLANTILGKKCPGYDRWPDDEWQRLREVEHFYRVLPKMPKADEMMYLARKFRDHLGWELYMLTALPHDDSHPECTPDKISWMKEYYPDVEVKFGPYSHDKWKHANTGDVLVDDRTSNCDEWRAAGGTAIQVLDGQYDLALAQLDTLFCKLY